ncbi:MULTISPECIES: type I restriction-modification system subunit M [Henriciella]|uniref:type I restriction-modification system subunit M n=1 Tax=Henriciella TaxID=453849 RepID=UPI0035133A3D
MALKKSELYASIWASCDALRGGMDASLYKDYVLVLLFIKYISDKYANKPFGAIQVPEGASFSDMVALKNTSDIGDQINKKIIGPLQQANKLGKMPDFNDSALLGDGKEKVKRLTDLISIFEDKQLDFTTHRAADDDILGDAYEYLMRHFATESGKSKGQFYTPSEVSRIMAKVIGIRDADTSDRTTVYDPTCGSGSLLLKVADEARTPVTLYGQEKDAATTGLAYMNMVLHDNPGAAIRQGNTLTTPHFTENGKLKQFDYVVANPPFSDKRWSTGLPDDLMKEPFERFKTFGAPPAKQGDYAYLLHIIRSLKSTGKAACILPHGVLFRGNAEATIRENLVKHGFIKAIIGLPANLFYGTGIPACIIVIDKSGAETRDGIFMIDASNGFYKDGPKNRLRSQDIHRIVDIYRKGEDVPRYARFVPNSLIGENGYNLNIPRYIDARPPEDIQDLEGHLRGGIPERDVAALSAFWQVCPNLKTSLFAEDRPGYLALIPEETEVREAINSHGEFAAFTARLSGHFEDWRAAQEPHLKSLAQGAAPKDVIHELSESLLAHYWDQPLIDPYDVYQILMDYWAETMQDDVYTIADGGWVAETRRIIEQKKDKDGKVTKTVDKGWTCDLVPKELIVARYFAEDQARIDVLADKLASVEAERAELEEEHSSEDAVFGAMDKINKSEVTAARRDADDAEEITVLETWLDLAKREAALKKDIKAAETALDEAAYATYPKRSEAEVKTLVVDDKWMAYLAGAIGAQVDQVAGELSRRVQALAARYEAPLPQLTKEAEALETQMERHLTAMGLSW